jgi:hypothetical protein
MQNLIMKIKQAIKAIENERGNFKIKCLVAKDPSNVQWDLILSADWFEPDTLVRLEYLSKKILFDFDIDCMIQFSSIITYRVDESNPLLSKLESIQNNLSGGNYNHLGQDYILIETNQIDNCKLVIPLNA